ncbi:MAG: hypothetical protein NY202_04820 [Mollicutes bacterium UO1]
MINPELGREILKKQIHTVETLASISETKEEFLKLMKSKYPKNAFDEFDLTKLEDNKTAEINEIKKPQFGSVNRSFKLDKRSQSEPEEILKEANEKYASRKKINASQLIRAMVHLAKTKPQEEIIEAIKETAF